MLRNRLLPVFFLRRESNPAGLARVPLPSHLLVLSLLRECYPGDVALLLSRVLLPAFYEALRPGDGHWLAQNQAVQHQLGVVPETLRQKIVKELRPAIAFVLWGLTVQGFGTA